MPGSRAPWNASTASWPWPGPAPPPGGADARAGCHPARRQRLSEQSEGLFNPAIGNLVRLWGFHSDTFEPRLPDPGKSSAWSKARPRMTDLQIDGLMLTGANPAVRLDLGGYAKGHALDLAAAYLKSQGVRNALINIGGNIMALGRQGGHALAGGHPASAPGRRPGHPGPQGRRGHRHLGRLPALLRGGRQALLPPDRPAHRLAGGSHPGGDRDRPRRHAGTLSDVASKPLFIAGPANWRA
jgi:thiamine biosynthesis lipoprotein